MKGWIAGTRTFDLPMIDSGRGAARAEHAQGKPTQSLIFPSILVYEDNSINRPIPPEAAHRDSSQECETSPRKSGAFVNLRRLNAKVEPSLTYGVSKQKWILAQLK